MQLCVSLLSLSLVLSSRVLLSQANSRKRSDEVSDSVRTNAKGNIDEKLRDILEYSDFEDDDDNDSDGLLNLIDRYEENVNSVMHFHQEQGEILVPCFGMWWPVGGASYDYVGDYYGDYKKKRRRSRKQKKAAKMKKKKS